MGHVQYAWLPYRVWAVRAVNRKEQFMKSTTIFVAGILLAGSAGLALAQPAGGAGRGGFAACQEDMAKFCADKAGPDRRQCMQDNMSKLSDGCKTALQSFQGRGAAPAQAPAGGR